jgi:hypothetical protein
VKLGRTRRSAGPLLAAVLIAAVLLAAGLLLAAGAQSSDQTASWSWTAAVPGTPTSRVAGGAGPDVRELAAAGAFRLVAASAGSGRLAVGPVVDGRAQLEPLDAAAGKQPLVVFTAASSAGGGQALVGVARSDIDRVAVTLGDGSQTDLPLNNWRGFSYLAAAAERAAVEVDAYAAGTPLGVVRLPQTSPSPGAAAAAAPVYGITRASFTAQTIRLSRIDSRTLQPLPGPSLLLRSQVAGPLALSPDEKRLALVTYNGETSDPSRLRIIDLQAMRVLRTFQVAKNLVRGLSWPEQDRLLELRQTMGPPYNRNVRSRAAWSINPATGARLGTGTLTNKLAIRQSVSTPAGLVLLLGTSGLTERADSQLAVVAADGSVKSVTLPLRSIKGGRLMSRMAVDSTTNHAYIVAPGPVVLDVDLSSMTSTRHAIARPAGAPVTPAAVGIPDAEIVDSKLAIAGFFPSTKGALAQGVALIDVTNWTARIVDAHASRFIVAGERILTYGPSSGPAPPHARVYRGLSLYDGSGSPITHLYGTREVSDLFATPGFGHAVYSGRSSLKQTPKIGPPLKIPNDQLVFDLHSGAARGGGPLSAANPPLGAPLLIFRGAEMVGEPGDRQPAAATAAATASSTSTHTTSPTTTGPTTTSPTTTSSTTTSSTTTTTTAPPLRTTQAAPRRPVGYTISNLGHAVAPRGRTLLLVNKLRIKLYLLGTAGGRAYYRVQVAPHFRCWGSGNANQIGSVGSLGCPGVVGAYPLQEDDMAISSSAGRPDRSTAPPSYLRIGGIIADGAVRAELRDSNGKTLATTAVTDNLFAFAPPYPKAFLRVVGVDAAGADLKPHPEWGQHQQPPADMFGPRATKVSPARLDQVLQHASARGIDFTVGHNDVVVVKPITLDAATKRLISGRSVGVSCFVVSPTIRHTRSAGVSVSWNGSSETAFKILGYIKPPFDGCEIGGNYGHRWHHQRGTHSPVEAAFTARGRRYFENRASARDLALFVRSRTMQRLRMKSGAAFIAAIRAQYGSRVTVLASETATAPAGTVAVWASGTRAILSERSRVGGRFYVQLDNGKISKENVRGLAFVF